MNELLNKLLTLKEAHHELKRAQENWYEDRDTTKTQLAQINEQLEPFRQEVKLAEFEARHVFNTLVQEYLNEQARNKYDYHNLGHYHRLLCM